MPDSPNDGSQQILTRLDLLESKIDWIARRVALGQPGSPHSPAQRASGAPARSGPRTAHPSGPAAGAARADAAQHVGPGGPGGPAPAAGTPGPPPAAGTPQAGPSMAAPGARPHHHYQPGYQATHQYNYQPSYPPGLQDPFRSRQLPHLPGGHPVPPGAHPVPPGAPPVPHGGYPVPPTRLRRISGEGNLGRYLLSGAAALLVVLAAVSLIALVWDQIPNAIKVGALGLLGTALVAAGTWTTLKRPALRVAASTMTGTGGALGFVAIIGAVLLGGILPLMGAFVLMALWGTALLVLSRLTARFFTAVISTIGALVTIGFASWQTWSAPAPGLSTWSLTTGYALVLAGITTVLARMDRPMSRAPWYPATSLAVLVAMLVLAPVPRLVEAGPLGAALLMYLIWAALAAQQFDSSRLLWRRGDRLAIGGDWIAIGFALGVSALRLILHLERAPHGELLVTLTGAIVMAILAAVSTAMLDPGPEGWRYRCAPIHLATTVVMGGILTLIKPELFVLLILISALASAPVLRERLDAPVALMPFLGCTAILLAQSRTSVVLGAIAGLLAALILTAVLDRAASRFTGAGGPTVQEPSAPLSLGAWGVAIALVLVLPVLVHSLLPPGRQWTTAVTALLAGLMLLALLCLGVMHPQVTPLRLLTLSLAGRFPTPAQAARAWWGWVLGGLGALSVLVVAASLSALAWRAALVLVAMALAAAATRMHWARFRQPEVTLAAAGLPTIVLWCSFSLLSGQSADSVLSTVVILIIGALCIVLGFRLRTTMLRHYGLALVLLAVLKLAVLDLGSHNSITRVLALAAAGVICFLLSLAYNRIAAEEQAPTGASPAPQPGGDPHPRP